jgi:hypothetical protein
VTGRAVRLCVVILNYRTGEAVVTCLRSLAAEREAFPALHVTVADNASPDDSLARIRSAVATEGWGDWVSLLPLPANGGFASGNNAAIRRLLAAPERPDYVLLLNPDTIVRRGALAALVAFLDARPEAGLAGSRIEGPDGEVECSAHRLPSPWSELDSGARLGLLSRWLARYAVSPGARDEPHPCDWVSGASLLVRREVFETVGLLDEGFFLYFEEVDFCARAQRAGWSCWYVPDARVVHDEGHSTGIRARGVRRPGYWYDSRRRYFLKRYGVAGLIAADLLWAAGRASLWLRQLLGLGGDTRSDPSAFARDLLWGDLKALASGRAFEVARD